MSDKNKAGGSNFFGAIAAIIAPTLIKLSVDAAVAELEKVRTVKSKGANEGYLFQVPEGGRSITSNLPACITMVTGAFKGNYTESTVGSDVDNATVLPPKASEAEILSRLNAHTELEEKDAKAKLYSVLELRVKEAVDGTAFRYEPAYMRVFDLMPGNRAKKQGLVYTVSITGPGAAPDGTSYSVAPISFGSVDGEFEVTDIVLNASEIPQRNPKLLPKLAKRKTGWLAIPGISDASKRSYFLNLSNGTAGGSKYMPYRIKADVVQTQKPSNAAKLLAKILSGSKDGLATKVGELVAPSDDFAKGQAKLSAQAAVYDAQVALQAAEDAVPRVEEAVKSAELKLEIAENARDNLQD